MGMFDDLIPSGDDYLKTRSLDDANTIRGLTNYKIDPNSLSIKGGHRERLLGGALQYDKDYDQAAYKGKAAAIKEFLAGGRASPAGQITAGNTAIKHMGDMADAAEDLKSMPGFLNKVAASGLPFASYAAAALSNSASKGTPEGRALARFMTARNHFSEEVTSFYSGGNGSEAERERALQNMDPNKSIEELRDAAHTEAKLIGGKVGALQTRYKNAMGPKAWLTGVEQAAGAIPDFPIVEKKSQEVLRALEERAMATKSAATNAPPAPDAQGWVTMPSGIRIREVPAAPAPTPGPQ